MCKKPSWDFDRDYVKSVHQLGNKTILIIVSLLIHDQGTAFHLFQSFISFNSLTVFSVQIFIFFNSFTGAHSTSVWNSDELSLVILRRSATLNKGWGSGVLKFKSNSWAFTAEVYISFYCLFLQAQGTDADKYLWYFGKHYPKMEVNNRFPNLIFSFNL